MPRLEIALLGSPHIQLDGHALKTDRRKAIALLAYLAVTGQPHTRDQLAALLWPDYEPDSAFAYLRRTLWELNQILGKGWISADRERVTLEPAPELWLDTATFQRLIHTGPGGVAAWSDAARLYRDDFLAGFTVADTAPFEDWHVQQAEHFRREFAGALEKLVDAHRHAGEPAPALPYARRWLALDPLNEAAHRAIMRLLAGMNDRTGAIHQYETCVQTLQAELGISPQPETTQLYETILRGNFRATQPEPATPVSAGAPRPTSHLPVMPTPFIGRRAEVEQIKTLTQNPQHHLVTLTGPGGTGKTRLALQVASEVEAAFPQGVFFASLAPVQAAEAVLPAVAQALDFSFYREEETPRQQLLDYLREKRLLLILDNFEHVLEAAGLVTDILTQAAGVKLMVTSRVRLNVSGEQLYPVSGMRTVAVAEASVWDDPEEQAKPFSAVQLFLDRARRVQPAFALTKDNARAVLEICRLVQGMPLALELAAAWVELLPPAAIAVEITRSLDFLETDQVGVPDRQRSLRAVFESSWKLLSEDERAAFLRLCVCVGSFSHEAAQHVSGASLKTLLGLANKSWLQPTGEGRFQLHDLMRQYGEERLRADDAAWREAKNQHAAYFADFVVEQTRRMGGSQQLAGLRAFEEEFTGNIKAAWDWFVAERRWGDIIEKILPGLYQFGNIRDRLDELIAWFRAPRRMLEAAGRVEERLALAILGTLEVGAEESVQIKDANPVGRLTVLWELVMAHDLAEPMRFWFVLLAGLVLARNVDRSAEALLEEAVGWVRQQNDPYWLGISLLIQSNIGGDFSFDEAKVREAGRLFKDLGVLYEQGVVARMQGQHASQQKRPPAEIIEYVNRSQQFFEQVGIPYHSAFNAFMLAGMYIQQGQTEQLFAHFHHDQRIMEQLGNVRYLGTLLQWESLYAARYSTFEHALKARHRSLELAQKTMVQSDVAWQHFELGDIHRIFGQAAPARELYEQAYAEFKQMNMLLGLGFYERAQGDLALAEARYAEALAHYEAFMRYVQQDNHTWSIGQAHAKLALAHACLANRSQARLEMRNALTGMRVWGQDELELMALLAELVCLFQEGNFEPAVELAAFIAHHPVSWNETKKYARATLATASGNLPEQAAQAASARGQALELEGVLERMLGPEAGR